MEPAVTFFPLGNADTARIDLANGRKLLIDFADVRNAKDPTDRCCDLAEEVRRDLEKLGRNHIDVLCFTHLDRDHVCGSGTFFRFEHAATHQGGERVRFDELWVPAGALTEGDVDADARIIRQEARYRLKAGKGIKVFSRPDALRDLLASWKLTVEDRAHCIVNAGTYVPGFSKFGPEAAQFFVHSPFGWRRDDREVEDRNQDSIVFQATFLQGGRETFGLFGSDVDHETLSLIVRSSKRHDNQDRLLWDVLKLFHHCSYLALGPERGVDETKAVDDVKWFFESQGRDGCVIVSTSDPIPSAGTEADKSVQPPHRQAANHHRRVTREKDGDFKVTMESPSRNLPKPLRFEITARGVRPTLAAATAIGIATSTPARAGLK